MKMEEGENLVAEKDLQRPTGTEEPVRDTERPVQEQPKFEIDLRVEGVPPDAILEDEVHMREMNEKLEKLKMDHLHSPFATT